MKLLLAVKPVAGASDAPGRPLPPCPGSPGRSPLLPVPALTMGEQRPSRHRAVIHSHPGTQLPSPSTAASRPRHDSPGLCSHGLQGDGDGPAS